MRTSILFIIFALSFFISRAQTNSEAIANNDPSINDSSVFSYCEIMPKFQTEEYAIFNEYIVKHMIYPNDAKAMNKSGMVLVAFIIEKDGSVSNVAIVKGRELYPSLDQEAIRVVSASPKWNPGMQNGKPVRVKQYMKVTFFLQSDFK